MVARAQAPLHRPQLDQAAAMGCQHQGCENAGHEQHQIWLHQRCHTGAPTFLDFRDPDVAAFRCCLADCGHRLIAKIAVKTKNMHTGRIDTSNPATMFTQTCCADGNTSAVRGCYALGKLTVTCYYCKEPVADFDVAD